MSRIAIIGTGISGMSAGYFLRKEHDITFFEKNDYAGGHTNTLKVDDEGDQITIDSAFMVYNEVTYPNLTRLFKDLGVKTKVTNMSFSVQHKPSSLEYSGTGYNGLFAQRRNILKINHVCMLLDINRFNKESLEVLDNPHFNDYSVDQYVTEKGYGKNMLYKYLIPMSSAVWSTPIDLMLQFPITTLVQFFKNHGFLGMTTQHQWRTVVQGSESYKKKIMDHFKGKVHLNSPIVEIIRKDNQVTIKDDKGATHQFDKVICASHADQTLKMLTSATDTEKDLLSKFKYQANKATLHRDTSIMPKCKRAWSSWNYRIGHGPEGNLYATTIYHMNKLQHVSKKNDYFVSINDGGEIDQSKVIWEKNYDHPLFSVEASKAQGRLQELNENGQVYFCGAYFKYGFHEDGLVSGINVAKIILGKGVWS
ncbi:MAG: putative NAD/FAD-binding protein [Candidatus Omnitrophota bacterium]|jgi:predicted NAD/FAD-binding protein